MNKSQIHIIIYKKNEFLNFQENLFSNLPQFFQSYFFLLKLPLK